jgi:hypothetical protein
MMNASRTVRFLSLAGVGAAALWLIGLSLFGTNRPDGTGGAEEILAYYQQHGEALGMAIFFFMLGSVLFLVFLASLWSRLRDAEGAGGPLATLVLLAGVIVAIGQFAVFGTDLDAASDGTAYALSASTAEAYFFSGDSWFVAAAMMAGLMLVATGIVAIRTTVLPRALGWVSVALAAPLLLPMLPIMPLVMLFAFPVWVGVTALVLVRPHARAAVGITAPA